MAKMIECDVCQRRAIVTEDTVFGNVPTGWFCLVRQENPSTRNAEWHLCSALCVIAKATEVRDVVAIDFDLP